MTTALIIVCIVFCIAIVLGIVTHLGVGIGKDKEWREGLVRRQSARGRRRRRRGLTER